MANTFNKGNQVIRTKFHQFLNSKEENQGFYDIIPTGIYKGLDLSTDGTNVTISIGTAFIKDDFSTSKTALRVETSEAYTMLGEVTSALPYITMTFEWISDVVNFADFVAKDVGSLASDDIILGKALFTGAVITGFDFTEREEIVVGLKKSANDDRKVVIYDEASQSLIPSTMQVDSNENALVQGYNYDAFDELSDLTSTDPYVGNGELWDFTSPSFISNKGNVPIVSGGSFNGNSGYEKFWPNKGSWYFSGNETYAILPTQLENEDSLEFWIYPNWGVSPASNITLIDSRQGETNNDDYVQLFYLTSNVYRFVVRDTSGIDLIIDSSVLGNPNILTHIKITWSKIGNAIKFYMNGVDQGASSGSGITGIDLSVRQGITIGSENRSGSVAPSFETSFWISELIHHKTYDLTLDHYNTNLPYKATNQKTFKKSSGRIDDLGNLAVNSITTKSGLLNDRIFPKDDFSEVYEGQGSLWDLTTPAFSSQLGEVPSFLNAEYNGNSGFEKFFSGKGSWYFSGDGTYAQVGFPGTNSFRIEFTHFPDYGDNPVSNPLILDSRNFAGEVSNLFIIQARSDNSYRFLVRSSVGNEIQIDTAPVTTMNEKRSIIVTADKGTNQAQILINGTQYTATPTGTGITTLDLSGVTKLVIGGNSFASTLTQEASMWLDEIIIENSYSLNTDHYNTGLPYKADNSKSIKNSKGFIDDNGAFGVETGFFNELFVGGSKVIDSGTNANGTYVKYSDGTMMCYGTDSTLLTTSVAAGNIWGSVDRTITYPSVYITPPLVMFGSLTVGGITWGTDRNNVTPKTTTQAVGRALGHLNTNTAYLTYAIFGRWK